MLLQYAQIQLNIDCIKRYDGLTFKQSIPRGMISRASVAAHSLDRLSDRTATNWIDVGG